MNVEIKIAGSKKTTNLSNDASKAIVWNEKDNESVEISSVLQ